MLDLIKIFDPDRNKNKPQPKPVSAKCNLVIPKTPTPWNLPDGNYYGVWEWFRVVVDHEGYEYHLIVAEGFHDHPIRCYVEVEDGKINVYTLSEKEGLQNA